MYMKLVRARRFALAVTLLLASAVPGLSLAQTLGSAPSWAASMAPGTWAAISTNTIASLDPANDPAANPNYPNSPQWSGNSGQMAVIAGWSGGAIATKFGAKGSLLAWGGGHADYWGNEVYSFDLATQRWSRMSNPYKTPSWPIASGIWPDGEPSVSHTAGKLGYHPGTNSFVSLMVQTSNNYVNDSVPAFFNLATKQWRHGARSPVTVVYGGWSAYDAKRDCFWLEGGDSGGQLARFSMNGDGTAGTWTGYGSKYAALDTNGALDPVHDIVAVTVFRQSPTIYALDLNNPSADLVALKQGGSPPNREGAGGWVWSTARNAFIYWRRGGDVYEVKLSGSDWRAGTWMWTKLTAAGNSVVPQDQSNGVYSRFGLVRYDDAEVAVVVNQVNGPVYAFKMPGTVTPQVRPNPPTDVTAN
jgi:hypothetical protein